MLDGWMFIEVVNLQLKCKDGEPVFFKKKCCLMTAILNFISVFILLYTQSNIYRSNSGFFPTMAFV